MKSIYDQTVSIRFYDCDCYERAKLSTINKLIADVAGTGYVAAGMTHQYLWDHGYVFLLSKVSISFDSVPHAGDEITVSTWERGSQGAFFKRDFEIFDTQKKKIISAVTDWILVNPITRQIIRPTNFDGIRAILPEKQAEAPKCKRLKMEKGVAVGEREVRFSDLDGNGHVYNAVYADIAVDALPPALRQREMKTYQINFIHEVKMGDTIALFLEVSDDGATVKGCVDGKDSFICTICYA
ncbi:MAG: thioesterase [Oscillospiraceae bacterium]